MEYYEQLFDDIIAGTRASFEGMSPRSWQLQSVQPWPDADKANILGGFDKAVEMGGSLRGGVNFLCATTDADCDIRDEILLYGPDLTEISGEAPYGRITLVKLRGGELDERQIFNTMLDLDVSKHRVAPDGFSVAYAEAARFEIVRVSRAAVQKGISLANIGACYARHYKRDPHVEAVTEIFVTDPAYDFSRAEAMGGKVQKAMITMRAHSTVPRRPEKKA